MSEPTAQEILDLPLPDNDSGQSTVRGYLGALLLELWRYEDGFSGKRPFGNSGWPHDIYGPMVSAGMVAGSFDEYGCLEDYDNETADRLMYKAIRFLGGLPDEVEPADEDEEDDDV